MPFRLPVTQLLTGSSEAVALDPVSGHCQTLFLAQRLPLWVIPGFCPRPLCPAVLGGESAASLCGGPELPPGTNGAERLIALEVTLQATVPTNAVCRQENGRKVAAWRCLKILALLSRGRMSGARGHNCS